MSGSSDDNIKIDEISDILLEENLNPEINEEYIFVNTSYDAENIQNQPKILRDANVNVPSIDHRTTNLFITEIVDIKKILESTFEGKHILSYHEKYNRLNPRSRTRLVHFVITAILKDCTRDLKELDFKVIGQKIVKIFPKESLSIYYTPHIPKNKSPTGVAKKLGGKLVNKYYNLKRLPAEIFKSNNKESKNSDKAIDNEDSSQELLDDIKESVDWLSAREEPWNETEEHWKKTYNYRTEKINKNFDKISTIYCDWPILKVPKGYELINIDFQLRKLCQAENPILGFENFFLKATEVKPLKKDEYLDILKNLLAEEILNSCEKTLIQIILLCHMVPSSARIPQGNKKYWKPSCAESLDGIIARIQIDGDLEKVKAERHVFAVTKKITVQPYIIVIGKSDHSVESVYLCIDKITYKIESLLEALDLCFKSFHVFNAKYPPQSEQLWLMLQLGLYEFKTKWDPTIINVNEILNDMKSATFS